MVILVVGAGVWAFKLMLLWAAFVAGFVSASHFHGQPAAAFVAVQGACLVVCGVCVLCMCV